MRLLVYFLLLVKASLFSTGGFANLPSLHDDFLARGWAHETQFTESLAVGQISPGPNGLWVISLGYLMNGIPGGLLAALAISLPPLLVFGVDWLYHRTREHPAVEGFVRGLSIATIGVFAVVLVRLITSVGANTQTLLIGIAAIAAGLFRRLPVVIILGCAALAGILLH